MSNEQVITNPSQSALTEFIIPQPQATPSYYRSKVFTNPSGINPLVNAATVIFSLIHRLSEIEPLDDTYGLYENLVHEIKAFEHTVQKLGYRSETILIARYVLCATLDEVILNTSWGAESDWHLHKLLATFQKDSWGGERFFLLLERLRQDAHFHLDLLELMYLCVCFGFQGKYREQDRGDLALTEIKEQLYKTIELNRAEFKKELSEVAPPKPTEPSFTRFFPPWLIGTFAAIILLTIFIGFNYLLGTAATPILRDLNTVLEEVDHDVSPNH